MTTLVLINAGSSSLKWQLMQLPETQPIAHRQVERLNLPDSIVKVVTDGAKTELTVAQLDEIGTINDVLRRLVDMAIIPSLSAMTRWGIG